MATTNSPCSRFAEKDIKAVFAMYLGLKALFPNPKERSKEEMKMLVSLINILLKLRRQRAKRLNHGKRQRTRGTSAGIWFRLKQFLNVSTDNLDAQGYEQMIQLGKELELHRLYRKLYPYS